MNNESSVATMEMPAFLSGPRVAAVKVRIGQPTHSHTEGWRCTYEVTAESLDLTDATKEPVPLDPREGLSSSLTVTGCPNSLEALCWALANARRALKTIQDKGVQLIDPDTGEQLDVDDAFVVPPPHPKPSDPRGDAPPGRSRLLMPALGCAVGVTLALLVAGNWVSQRTLAFSLRGGERFECIVELSTWSTRARLVTDTERCRVATGVQSR